MRHKIILIASFISMAGLVSSPAHAALNNPDITKYVSDAEKVGEGRLKYMFWDVYDAALYAPGGDLNEGEPLALKISYLRDIPGEKIAKRSAEEMRGLGVTDEVKLAGWFSQMKDIFPDVREGVIITGIKTNSGETIFYRNDKQIGRINDAEFTKYFFDIWLDPNTSSPDLRRKLVGR